jgi:alpha-L-fucosidase 2
MTEHASTPRVLWYDRPADKWDEALPLGNGHLGAMVFGGTAEERVALNHENLWRGNTRERSTSPKAQFLPEIRARFFAGELVKASELANQQLGGHAQRKQPYQPLGDLRLEFPGHAEVQEYRRSLELNTGIAQVRYRVGEVAFLREHLVSAEHGVLALRVTADRAGAIDMGVTLNRFFRHDQGAAWACQLWPWGAPDRVGFRGHFIEGIDFAAEARVFASGGEVTAGRVLVPTQRVSEASDEWPMLQVKGADEVLLLLTMATDYREVDPVAWCARHLDGVPADYALLWDAHVREHRALFERVEIDLGPAAGVEALSTGTRVARVRDGAEDPDLTATLFQFGRYLLMSSSRRCDQPANLRGIWNEQLEPPWQADFHHDIDLQMAYWPAEVCNLPECHQALFDYMWRLVPDARKVAKDLYDCQGIVFPLATDIWDRAAPADQGWDVWTGAAPWLAQHIWQHYEYSLDPEFLRGSAYPFIKEVAAFYKGFLVRDPQGRLVTVPSQSPENYFVGGTRPVSLCVAATLDLELIHELLTHAMRASEILGVDEELRERWRAILRDIPPLQVGRHGQLQEWLEDYPEAEPGHRHVSHLYGLFPGDQFTPEKTPELARAAEASLHRRVEHGALRHAWGAAWGIALYARLRDAEPAYRQVRLALAELGPNLMHPVLLDSSFGCAAGIAEMLLQSHHGEIRLLPALPRAWPSGSVRGLRARGGYKVDISWRDGALVRATIRAQRAGQCVVRASGLTAVRLHGRQAPMERIATDAIAFPTLAGESYGLT